ncbi:MAG TPA: UvrD-helicase domain-containing protein [Pseudolabrys sp.]|nr:UvrD-helicase domain-containing protein [Pseudolabrys sp.]
MSTTINDDTIDDVVDDEIHGCLNLSGPTSFFLFAGAGSGKTRSLVRAVNGLRAEYGRRLLLKGQRFGVITYTNAACDEIKQRLEFDPLVDVATIHSFAWDLIAGFNNDIRDWLRQNLAQEIAELEEAQRKGRAASKAAQDRAKSIESKNRRLASLDTIKRFIYSPSGDNRGRDSLNHSEVISITSAFLSQKATLQRIFVNKYPFLLIDESQDTNKHLMEALLVVQAEHSDRFCLGLFGDTMQRIYADGKIDLPSGLPAGWKRPAKKMNHRCPSRVVRLINKIRSAVDGHVQQSRSDKDGGTVRLFIYAATTADKFKAEDAVARRMLEITADKNWDPATADYKTLTLEHHMAARRMGFLEYFSPLYAVDRLRTGLLDGSLPGLPLFINEILPLVQAKLRGDEYAAAAVVRKMSPLLEREHLKKAGAEQPAVLAKVSGAVKELMGLWKSGSAPMLIDVLRCVHSTGLFKIPDALLPIAARNTVEAIQESAGELETELDERNDAIAAWDSALAVSFDQLAAYASYISGEARFDTHQGVKGLEFPRVMVVVDDEESRGFLFSYDKLFGAKAKSDTDVNNERSGKETTIDRTRRLFYVTCSRAESSLAIVHYSADPKKVREYAIAEGWFDADEIEILG